MTSNSRSGGRTGRPPKFTAEDAVHAALDLGIADFTLSQVARTLRITTPALYRHFPSRDALVAACLRHAFRDIPAPPESTRWRDILEGYADSLWMAFTRHSGMHRVFDTFALPPDFFLPGFRTLRTRLYAMGFSHGQISFARITLLHFTASAAGMMQRQQSFLRNRNFPDLQFRSAEGLVITTDAEIAECCHRQWKLDVGFFPDHLDSLDNAWPEWEGPRLNPEESPEILM